MSVADSDFIHTTCKDSTLYLCTLCLYNFLFSTQLVAEAKEADAREKQKKTEDRLVSLTSPSWLCIKSLLTFLIFKKVKSDLMHKLHLCGTLQVTGLRFKLTVSYHKGCCPENHQPWDHRFVCHQHVDRRRSNRITSKMSKQNRSFILLYVTKL